MVVSACSGSDGDDDSGTLRVAVWDAAEEASRGAYLELIEKFEEEHPDIEIEEVAIPFSDIEQQVLQQAQAGDAPDVVQLAGSYMYNFQAAGILQPIDDLAGEEYLNEIVPEARDLVTVDGQVFAAPWALQPIGLWYNKAVLESAGLDPESPPETIEELLDQLRTIAQEQPDAIPLGMDSTNRVFGLDVSWPWMMGFGAQPITDGSATANTPEMAEYLEFVRTIAQENLTEVNQKIGYFRPLAAAGDVAFLADGTIAQAVIQETAGIDEETFHEQWAVTTLPAAPGGEPTSVAQDHQLGVLSSSENQEDAWTFVEWMTRSEQAMTHVISNKGSLPPVVEPGGEAAQLMSDSPALQTWAEEVVPSQVVPPWGPDYSASARVIMVAVQQMMTGDEPVDSVMEEMQGQLETEWQ